MDEYANHQSCQPSTPSLSLKCASSPTNRSSPVPLHPPSPQTPTRMEKLNASSSTSVVDVQSPKIMDHEPTDGKRTTDSDDDDTGLILSKPVKSVVIAQSLHDHASLPHDMTMTSAKTGAPPNATDPHMSNSTNTYTPSSSSSSSSSSSPTQSNGHDCTSTSRALEKNTTTLHDRHRKMSHVRFELPRAKSIFIVIHKRASFTCVSRPWPCGLST